MRKEVTIIIGSGKELDCAEGLRENSNPFIHSCCPSITLAETFGNKREEEPESESVRYILDSSQPKRREAMLVAYVGH